MDAPTNDTLLPAPADPAPYRPSMLWLVLAFVGWLISVPAVIQTDKGVVFGFGTVVGTLALPAVVRLIWTAIRTGRRELIQRALFSPWLWVLAIVLDFIAALGKQS